MTETLLSEQLSGAYHSIYENIISQIVDRHYAVADYFFETELLKSLCNQISSLYNNDALKKAAIGKHFDEHIVTEIRGDYIQWINEKSINETEVSFFQSLNHFVDYLNRTCFMGILHKEFHYAVYPQGRFYKRHLAPSTMTDDENSLWFCTSIKIGILIMAVI